MHSFATQLSEKGGNLICIILCVVLNDLDATSELPFDLPVLYLQVDDCGENKNMTLIAFLADLVLTLDNITLGAQIRNPYFQQ